jgi:2-isopropylmalate synthase
MFRILPVDPSDLGRSYDSIIRVNSQSGKGGVAYLLERDYQLVMPRRLQIEFSQVVQAAADITGKELTSQELWDLFTKEYLAPRHPSSYRSHQLAASTDGADSERLSLQVEREGRLETWHGQGSGPIDAMVKAIGLPFDVLSYEEHSRGRAARQGRLLYRDHHALAADACSAPACIATSLPRRLLAILSAVNRALAVGALPARTDSVLTGT